MTDPLLIPCPHCNGLNRIPAARLGEHPKCGRCKNEVLLSKPFELNQADYASQIKGDLPLLVDVWAEWCGPCKSFAPVFEQAASQWSASAGWPSSTARPTSNWPGNWASVRSPA
jgi:thioredoxin 2